MAAEEQDEIDRIQIALYGQRLPKQQRNEE
jgi:hypothetical protein